MVFASISINPEWLSLKDLRIRSPSNRVKHIDHSTKRSPEENTSQIKAPMTLMAATMTNTES